MSTQSFSSRIDNRDLAMVISWLEANGKRPTTVSRAIFTAVRLVAQRIVAEGSPYPSEAEAQAVLEFYKRNDEDGPVALQLGGLATTEEGEDRARRLLEE